MEENHYLRGKTFLSMLTNPIFVAIYWVAFYELYTLCKYGKINNNVIVLFGCMLFFLIWLIITIIRIIKIPKGENQGMEEKNQVLKKIWTYLAIVIIILITSCYGVKIYQSSINYNGKLSWVLHDLNNKKTVKLEHNDIYKNGIEGIFTDIDKKIILPKKLYISNSFSLNFDSDGKIISFDTYLYGKNDKGKLESYLISYNSSKSENITIYLKGYVNADYNEDKLLKPLRDTMKVIPLKDTISSWNEKQYGILYYGRRSFGYNIDGIVYINSKGDTRPASKAPFEIIGYAVSVYIPGKENVETPNRYIMVDDLVNIKPEQFSSKTNQNNNENTIKQSNKETDELYISDKIGYHLEVTAAAAGSRSYSLNKTTDGGATWEVINKDPFKGSIGVAAGITFLNEKLGFLCLSHSEGCNGELYRTEDGGLSYEKVNFPAVKVSLGNGENNNPFDLPEMPYKINGDFCVLVGQGSDGDYNGGCKALYQSKDEGKNWEYIKEVTN